jgi:hypothetical protein
LAILAPEVNGTNLEFARASGAKNPVIPLAFGWPLLPDAAVWPAFGQGAAMGQLRSLGTRRRRKPSPKISDAMDTKMGLTDIYPITEGSVTGWPGPSTSPASL